MKWLLVPVTASLLFAAVYFEERGRRDFERRDTARRAAMAAACRASARSIGELFEERRVFRRRLADCAAVVRAMDDCTCFCPGDASVDSREDR